MEVVACKAKESSCTLRPAAMLFHGISGDHIQGIMEEMERRSKSESRLGKTVQMNGRETVRFWVVSFGFYLGKSCFSLNYFNYITPSFRHA